MTEHKDLESSSEKHVVRMSKRGSFQKRNANNAKVKVRLNLVLREDVARILVELRSRGIVRSYADCINQSVQVFYAAVMKQDLLLARLKALEKGYSNDNFGGEE